MARGTAEPWTERPAHAPAATDLAAADVADSLTIRAGDAEWTLAAGDILFVAEPAVRLTPIPHASWTVRGLACIEGRPFAVVDPAADRSAARQAGGALAVVASGNGGVALRIDAVSRNGQPAPVTPSAGSEILSSLAPWAPPPAAGRPAALPVPAAAAISLLFVACGEVTAALPVLTAAAGGAVAGVTVERVGTVASRQPLRAQGVDALVRVDDFLLPARSLADALPIPPRERSGGAGERWAVVLGFEGQRAALLVDRVIGVIPCDPRHIIAMTLPGGAQQQWLDHPEMQPVPIMEAAPLFGWPAAAVYPVPSCSPDREADLRAEPVLTARACDVELALPLALVDRVMEPGTAPAAERTPGAVPVFDAAVALGRRTRPRCGTLVRLTPEGAPPFVISVDRTAVIAEPQSPWIPVEPLPPVAALAFDAVGLAGATEGEEGRWMFRLRCRLPSPSALPMPVRRCLAAARLGWVAPETMPL